MCNTFFRISPAHKNKFASLSLGFEHFISSPVFYHYANKLIQTNTRKPTHAAMRSRKKTQHMHYFYHCALCFSLTPKSLESNDWLGHTATANWRLSTDNPAYGQSALCPTLLNPSSVSSNGELVPVGCAGSKIRAPAPCFIPSSLPHLLGAYSEEDKWSPTRWCYQWSWHLRLHLSSTRDISFLPAKALLPLCHAYSTSTQPPLRLTPSLLLCVRLWQGRVVLNHYLPLSQHAFLTYICKRERVQLY